MEKLTLSTTALDKNEFLMKLNRLCLKFNKEFSFRTPLDLVRINQMESTEFIQLLDRLEQECTGSQEIQTYISQLRRLVKPSATDARTDRHPPALSANPENILKEKVFYSYTEALKLAEQFDMEIVFERHGRDTYYKLIPLDQRKQAQPGEHKANVIQEPPEFLEKYSEVKKIEKRLRVKYEPVRQGRDIRGYKLVVQNK